MESLDPFAVFRNTLFVALAIYTLVTTAMSVARVFVLLRGHDPRRQLLRVYLSYQLLSIRLRPLAGELWQIVLWCAMLLLIWWLHTRI